MSKVNDTTNTEGNWCSSLAEQRWKAIVALFEESAPGVGFALRVIRSLFQCIEAGYRVEGFEEARMRWRCCVPAGPVAWRGQPPRGTAAWPANELLPRLVGAAGFCSEMRGMPD